MHKIKFSIFFTCFYSKLRALELYNLYTRKNEICTLLSVLRIYYIKL